MFNFDFQGEMQKKVEELKQDPQGAAKQRGWNIPEDKMGNPQAMVMHLIQTGQVGGPILQRIMPMIRQMGGK